MKTINYLLMIILMGCIYIVIQNYRDKPKRMDSMVFRINPEKTAIDSIYYGREK